MIELKIVIEENKYTLYIYSYKEDVLYTKDKDTVEAYFKNLFLKLKKYYQIELNGYYDIHIYHNKNYGNIITVEKEEYDYYNYYDDKLDMRISFEPESEFLYELEDLYIKQKEEDLPIYLYNSHLYAQINKTIPSIEMAQIVEHSKIVYGEEVEHILSFGKML